MRDWKWSPAEKTIARKAFNLAFDREIDALILEAKKRTARIGKASELWDLERWLGERRTHLDRDYDYRYSVLPFVFARLLRDDRLSEEDLSGLDRQKLDAIRLLAGL